MENNKKSVELGKLLKLLDVKRDYYYNCYDYLRKREYANYASEFDDLINELDDIDNIDNLISYYERINNRLKLNGV